MDRNNHSKQGRHIRAPIIEVIRIRIIPMSEHVLELLLTLGRSAKGERVFGST